MKICEKLDVDVYDSNSHIVGFNVNCFPRMLYIVYREEPPYFMLTPEQLYKKLEDAYFEWHKDSNGDTCCEEFMLNQLDEETYNHIIMVMYDIDEEEE